MIEALLVIGAVALLSGTALVLPLLAPEAVLFAGAGLIVLGLVSGVPTGLWYHVALHRCLGPRGELPPRWWLHPVALHPRLESSERARVLRWFVAGGIGFGVVVLGCIVVLCGVVAQLLSVRAL